MIIFILNFNYKCKENIDLSNQNVNYSSSEVKALIKMKKKVKNRYNKLLIKILKYLSGNDIINDMKESSPEKNSILNLLANNIGGIPEQLIYQVNIPIIKNITLLSLYFNKYPYLLNLLSFQGVEEKSIII